MADEIHSTNKPAPYSVTPVIDAATAEPVYRYLLPEKIFYFNVTALGERLSGALSKGIMALNKVSFNGTECKVEAIDFRLIELRELWKRSVPVNRFAVRFITPTRFTAPPRDVSDLLGLSGDRVWLAPPRNVMFPDPERLLVSLLNFWVANLGETPVPNEAYRRWLKAGGVACSGYPKGIKTVSLKRGGASIGFLGRVHYVIPSDSLMSETFMRFTDALLKLGELFNVGDERTAGLGMIKYSRYEVSHQTFTR
ncbi:MAG: CRISPR system precrRNA processing endoribonuclease RAMP protein Cas6 [Nitrososphaerota archaeon]|nr:CRISPR system precrRNA processing endoribonuclease RAMP protein Cas6 [Nitrososphaerota archaeon]